MEKMVIEIGIIAPLIMWNIWCTRNKLVFEGTQSVTTSNVASIFSQLHISHRAFGSLSSPSSTQTPREVCWQHGDNDTLVRNVEGSALTNPGQAGYGGIVRNFDEKFMFGFYGSVGLSNILHAEIQALLT